MFEWVEHALSHDCRPAPNSTLYAHPFDMVLKDISCWRHFVTFCQMFAKQMSSGVRDTCDLNTCWEVGY